jgi:hypothetical protein
VLWYIAYGSNLAAARFHCYLSGGCPEGGSRNYSGCRDSTPARASLPMLLPGGVYFALTSLTWGGGMAFYDPLLPARAAARGYLLSPGQFADVVHQEMRRDVGTDLDLSEAIATGRQRLGPGRYETVLKVGVKEGVPMLTFTAPHGAARAEQRAELNPPSAPYAAMLGRGLQEAHGWSARRAVRYLLDCPGVREGWDKAALGTLLEVG